ncbi:unnamed protein product [Lota lota]
MEESLRSMSVIEEEARIRAERSFHVARPIQDLLRLRALPPGSVWSRTSGVLAVGWGVCGVSGSVAELNAESSTAGETPNVWRTASALDPKVNKTNVTLAPSKSVPKSPASERLLQSSGGRRGRGPSRIVVTVTTRRRRLLERVGRWVAVVFSRF